MSVKLAELGNRYADEDTARVVEIDVSGGRKEMTHRQLHELVRARADQLAAAGVGEGHVIGLRARNSIDWVSWDLAALMVGAVIKAFPDAQELPDAGEFLAHHGLALLITDDPPPGVPAVIAPDGTPGPAVVPDSATRVVGEDLHSLVYSSGTTGRLKGLQISAKGTEYVIALFIEHFKVTSADRHLIFLPLSNYQQRLSVYCCLWLGADLVLAPYQRVFNAVRDTRPTFLIGPPVFYETLLQLYRKTGGGSLPDFLGGAVRFLITGMAPIRRATLDAYWAEGVSLLEAYGLTETGMVAWNTPDAHRNGTVGRLIDPSAVIFRPDGELVIDRPAPLSSGYFDHDDQAADVFLPDGGIATGDYGDLDEDGFLTLAGRKKDVIALGSGRKVHPARIESAFTGIEGVAEFVVVPTPQSGRLGAIVTPAAPDDAALTKRIRAAVDEVNRGLEASERVMSLVFSASPLGSDQRFLTANLKLSRIRAAEYFAEAVGHGG
ncbi:AMP-binding protein [Streptomyces sp. NPDC059850]|uniref:AMP-binding protein n=1 Tax=Streptomyces sp. NPDC059850 TaxID=3346970 RepID=UPI0036599896